MGQFVKIYYENEIKKIKKIVKFDEERERESNGGEL